MQASLEAVVNFVAYLDLSGKAYGANAAVSAISRWCKENIGSSWKVKQTVKGIQCLNAKKDWSKEVRQPLPVSAIRAYGHFF